MAHHAPDPADEPGGFLPQSNLRRAVVVLVAAAVLGAATLALWATGGLERADAAPKQDPGSTVRTRMYTVTPHRAEFVTADDGRTALQVRAELVSKHTEPFAVSSLESVIKVSFPSGDIDAERLDLTYTRNPEGFVSEVQPDMREDVLMTWTLRKAEAEDKKKQQEENSDNPLAGLEGEPAEEGGLDLGPLTETPEDVAPLAEKEDKVTLSFSKTKFAPGFTDQNKSWRAVGGTAAKISFPLGKG